MKAKNENKPNTSYLESHPVYKEIMDSSFEILKNTELTEIPIETLIQLCNEGNEPFNIAFSAYALGYINALENLKK